MPLKQYLCVCLVLWIACKTIVERPPTMAKREIDASANFARPPFGRFLSDLQKPKPLDQIRTSFRSGQDLSNDILGLKID